MSIQHSPRMKRRVNWHNQQQMQHRLQIIPIHILDMLERTMLGKMLHGIMEPTHICSGIIRKKVLMIIAEWNRSMIRDIC